jgi:acetyl-CoA acetyltransferase
MAKKKDIAVVAYGETQVDLQTGRSSYDLASEVFEQVLSRTGLVPADIDGLCIAAPISEPHPFWGVYASEMLGISPKWMQLNGMGGASTIGGIARAASAIRDGLCETVFVCASDAQSSGPAIDYGAFRPEFLYPTGLKGPVGAFGFIMNRYRHQYGLKDEALAKLAVTQRNHALLNDKGCPKLRKPITEADYLKSKMVSDPLRILDSVMVCDGANGVLVTSTENAKRIGAKKMAHPVGYGEITNYKVADLTADITESGFTYAGPRALQQAGMQASDVRMIMPYDDFLIAILLQFEQIGFCGTGEGSDFILRTDLSHKGTLPLNTSGGQISAGQPGLAGGGLNAVEAVRQLFEEAGPRQVENPRNAMATGIGSIPYARNWMVSNVMILEQA